MPNRPRAITIGVLAVIVPLAALAVWIGVSAVYMPGCSGCHLQGEFATRTAAGVHAALECKSCHGGVTIASRAEFGVHIVLGMHLPLVATDPSLSNVPDATCDSCHEDGTAGVVENAGLRVRHSECARAHTCTTCHSPTAHGSALAWPRTASMELCFECHADVGAPVACDSCHSDRLPTDRIKTGTFAVTHGPDYLTTHGMGRMTTCGPCHAPDKCVGCHGAGVPHAARFVQQHAQIAADPAADCTSCHLQTFCSNCHGLEMPHPPSFTAEHSQIVEREGEEGCATCHAPDDCTRCHEMHVHPTTIEQLEGFGILTPQGGEE